MMAATRQQLFRLRAGLLLAGLLVATGTCQAGLFRCTGVDGKVVYSDQPCVQGRATGEGKGVPAPAAPAATATGGSSGVNRSPSVKDMHNKAQHDRVHASLSPECRALGGKLSHAVQRDSNASMDEVKRAIREFEGKCGDQLAEAMRKENAHGGSHSVNGKNSKPDAATCRSLRETLNTDRARLGRMTDKEKMAFAAQQNEVSVACP